MKYHFATATYRSIYPVAAASREDVQHHRDKIGHEMVGWGIYDGYGAPRNIQLACRDAVQYGADAIVFHDWDVAFTHETVRCLLDLLVAAHARNPLSLVGGVYRSSANPMTIVGRTKVGGAILRTDDDGGPSASEAEHIGLGLAAWSAELIRALPDPPTLDVWSDEEKDWMTPDTLLCKRVREMGGAIWISRLDGNLTHTVSKMMGV